MGRDDSGHPTRDCLLRPNVGALNDFCITQLKAQGPSRTCNESKEEEEALNVGGCRDAASPSPGSCQRGSGSFDTLSGLRVQVHVSVGAAPTPDSTGVPRSLETAPP